MGVSFASKDSLHALRDSKRVKALLEAEMHRKSEELDQINLDVQRLDTKRRRHPEIDLTQAKNNLEGKRKSVRADLHSLSIQLREAIKTMDESSAATIQGGGGNHAAPALFRRKPGKVEGKSEAGPHPPSQDSAPDSGSRGHSSGKRSMSPHTRSRDSHH